MPQPSTTCGDIRLFALNSNAAQQTGLQWRYRTRRLGTITLLEPDLNHRPKVRIISPLSSQEKTADTLTPNPALVCASTPTLGGS